MNTSYNYADFIGLDLDSNSVHDAAEHPLYHEELTTQKPVIKIDQLPTLPKRDRHKQ